MLINFLLLTLLVGRCGQVFRTLLKSEVNAVRRFTIHSQSEIFLMSQKSATADRQQKELF
jgi:hypothetical protein